MSGYIAIFAVILSFAGQVAIAQEDDKNLKIVASIKPIHSLAALLTEGIAEPSLLIPANASPHGYQLRPSEAASLQNADILFWVGAEMEGRHIASLAGNARIVTLFEPHGHEDAREHEHEDEHTREDDHEHDGEHEEHEHSEDETDLHIWLDPHRAKEMVEVMIEVLAEIDPKNANIYRGNGEALLARLQELDEQLAARIEKLHGGGSYIFFHAAYGHFEARYGLPSSGSMLSASAHGHEHGPSAHRLSELRERILDRDENIACVFVEPAFGSGPAETLVEGTDKPIVLMDPIGADIPEGKDAYFLLLENLALSFEECLGTP